MKFNNENQVQAKINMSQVQELKQLQVIVKELNKEREYLALQNTNLKLKLDEAIRN